MEKKIELLAPAGTPEALEAAILAGADAVYFGGAAFNARMNAGNFDAAGLQAAIERCAFFGVKSHITLNTLVGTRERDGFLHTVEMLYRMGADALIIADLGMARLVHSRFPDFSLHASTQLSGHNTAAAETLAALGFSRMVCARELDRDNIAFLCRNAPIEIEMFLHGAVCVSQSGQCLMSAMVGGRSGNRGECAQPCRLPYRFDGADAVSYPLSLKDLCLAGHITEILQLGVRSLKIEGRMKSPAYVYGTTALYRRLIDEKRNATADELNALGSLFSRGGVSNGDHYFTGLRSREMTAIRTERDKQRTRDAEKQASSELAQAKKNGRRLPVAVRAEVHGGQPAALTLCTTRPPVLSVTVTGEVPQYTENSSSTEERILVNLKKFGNTPFFAETAACAVDEGLFLPLSAVNALRRNGTAALEALYRESRNPHRAIAKHASRQFDPCAASILQKKSGAAEPLPFDRAVHGCFFRVDGIFPDARRFFNRIWLSLEAFCDDPARALAAGVDGVMLPPVIFDSQYETVKEQLQTARMAGISHGMTGNIGQISLLQNAGMEITASYRCNISTSESAEAWIALGARRVCLSPELTLPQLRDIRPSVPKGAIVYGTIPLMTLERCLLRDDKMHPPTPEHCRICSAPGVSRTLIDRTGAAFALVGLFGHRNLLLNSVPFWMGDRQEALKKAALDDLVFFFTTETAAQAQRVVQCWNSKVVLPGNFRRIAAS